MKIIINLYNLKFNKNFYEYTNKIEPQEYKFSGIKVQEGIYKVGAKKETFLMTMKTPVTKYFLKTT